MRCELPSCTRCCFCLPLRRGILTWAYIKAVLSLCLIIFCTINIICQQLYSYVSVMIFMTVVLIDFIFTVILIVASHKRHHKLVKAYYIYGLVMAVLHTLLLLTIVLFTIIVFRKYMTLYLIFVIAESAGGHFIVTVLHIYLTLLVRSEMLKFKNNNNYRFVNNTIFMEPSPDESEQKNEDESDHNV